MKKILITLLITASILSLVSCGSAKNNSSGSSASSNETVQSTNDKDTVSNKDKDETTKKDETTNKEPANEKDESATITVYMPNDNADGLDEKAVTISHLTAYSVVNALADNNVVPKGTTALKFEIKDGIGYLDVSSKIYKLESGSIGEKLMLDALRETFLKAFKIDKVELTVEGSTYTGSHMDYAPGEYL